MGDIENGEEAKRRRKQEAYERELARQVYVANPTEPPLRYEGRSKDLSIIPDEIVYAGDHLSHGEVRLWLAIFAQNKALDPTHRVSWPGRDRLALMLGIHPRRVSHFLKGLRTKGLLRVKRRMGMPSSYVLKDVPKGWAVDTKARLKLLSTKKDESPVVEGREE